MISKTGPVINTNWIKSFPRPQIHIAYLHNPCPLTVLCNSISSLKKGGVLHHKLALLSMSTRNKSFPTAFTGSLHDLSLLDWSRGSCTNTQSQTQTRQSKHCGFSIYTFDNLKSKSMSGLVFARRIARVILIQNI